MEERNSDMSEDTNQSCALKRCLVLAGWIPCLYGFQQHGCLCSPSGQKNVWWEGLGGRRGAVTPISSLSYTMAYRVVVSLLPGSLEVENWLLLARQKRNMWPMQINHTYSGKQSFSLTHCGSSATQMCFGFNRRRSLRINCSVGRAALGEVYERLFLNKYGSKQRFYENEYHGYDYQEVEAQWVKTRQWFQQSATAHFPSQLVLSPHFLQPDYADAKSLEWIRQQEHNVAQLWHTKQGVYRRKVLADVRDEPMQVQQ